MRKYSKIQVAAIALLAALALIFVLNLGSGSWTSGGTSIDHTVGTALPVYNANPPAAGNGLQATSADCNSIGIVDPSMGVPCTMTLSDGSTIDVSIYPDGSVTSP
jgi:hypothetical protein